MNLADYPHLNPISTTLDTTRLTMQKKRYHQLAKCFLLGEYLQAENFKNVVMSDIIQTSKDYFQEFWVLDNLRRLEGHQTPVENLPLLGVLPDDIADVYTKTSSNSLLRRFFVDMTAAFLRDDGPNVAEPRIYFHDAVLPGLQQKAPEYAAELFRLINLELFSGELPTDLTYPWRRNVCHEYHSHTDPFECGLELTTVSLSIMKVI
jgi:hypothetical protein